MEKVYLVITSEENEEEVTQEIEVYSTYEKAKNKAKQLVSSELDILVDDGRLSLKNGKYVQNGDGVLDIEEDRLYFDNSWGYVIYISVQEKEVQ